MLTSVYIKSRQSAKYNLLKDTIALWCSKAKKGDKMLIRSMLGNFVLKYDGRFKPKEAEIKIVHEQETNNAKTD